MKDTLTITQKMKFWLKVTAWPNIGLWKNLHPAPLGLILGVTLFSSFFLGGGGTAGLMAGTIAEEPAVALVSGSLLAESAVYAGSEEGEVKANAGTLVLTDKSSLVASPAPTKLARRR